MYSTTAETSSRGCTSASTSSCDVHLLPFFPRYFCPFSLGPFPLVSVFLLIPDGPRPYFPVLRVCVCVTERLSERVLSSCGAAFCLVCLAPREPLDIAAAPFSTVPRWGPPRVCTAMAVTCYCSFPLLAFPVCYQSMPELAARSALWFVLRLLSLFGRDSLSLPAFTWWPPHHWLGLWRGVLVGLPRGEAPDPAGKLAA